MVAVFLVVFAATALYMLDLAGIIRVIPSFLR
jgi:hypothetical protein